MSFDDFINNLNVLFNQPNWRIHGSSGSFIDYVNQTPRPTGDEMNVRTSIVFPLFQYLGWPSGTNPSIWDHDVAISSQNRNRPDSIARSSITHQAVFVLDTKSSNEILENYLGQIKNYAIEVGVRYGILCNGKRILVKDYSKNIATTIFDLKIKDWIEMGNLNNFKPFLYEFYELFKMANFHKIDEFIKEINISRRLWLRRALPIGVHIEEFISRTTEILEEIGLSFLNQFSKILHISNEYYEKTQYVSEDDHNNYIEKNGLLEEEVYNEINNSPFQQSVQEEAIGIIKDFLNEPFKYSSLKKTMQLIPSQFRTNSVYRDKIKVYLEFYLNHQLYVRQLREFYEHPLKIKHNFNIWKETIGSLFNTDHKIEFTIQSAYLLFIRILFIRICEDHEIFERRLSDGAFKSWHKFINTFYKSPFSSQTESSMFQYSQLLNIVFGRTRLHYDHFFQDQDIFKWFELSDLLFLKIISLVSKYNFKDLNFDIIGKIYEKFVDTYYKKQKGLFYTPPEIIEFILDEIGYISSNDIADKTLVDFSCGSGSFLVHAAKRLIEAHRNHHTGTIDYPEVLKERLSKNLIGLDINPFSCYLAEINLYLEYIKALASSGNITNIGRFSIFQTNSLDTHYITEQRNLGQFVTTRYYEEMQLVEYIKTKKGDYRKGFDFYVGNPPYGAKTVPKNLQGEDSFILFLRMGLRLLSKGGKIGYLVPGAWLTHSGSRGTTDTMAPNRKHILERLDLISINNLFDIAFPEVYVDNIILVGKKSIKRDMVRKKRVKINHLSKLTGSLNDLEQRNWDMEFKVSQFKWVKHNYTIDLLPICSKYILWQRIQPSNRSGGRYHKLEGSSNSLGQLVLGISPYQGWRIATHGFNPQEARRTLANYADVSAGADSYLQGESKHGHRWFYFFNVDQYKWIENYGLVGSGPPNPDFWFRGERVLFRRQINRARRFQVCYVSQNDFAISKSSYVIKAQDGTIETLKYLFAILNSKTLSYINLYLPYLKMVMIRDDFPALEPNYLRSLPIPQPDSSEKTQIIQQLDITQSKYHEIGKFLKDGSKIGIYSSSSGRTEMISFEKPDSFTFLTYIRDITRINIYPRIKHQSWTQFLSDWHTRGKFSYSGNLNDKITMNDLDDQSTPPKLIIRYNIKIESNDIDILKFFQLLIEFYNPENLNEIFTTLPVPNPNAINNYLTNTYPQEKRRIRTIIEEAWNQEDILEELVKDMYEITPQESQMIDALMNKWIRI